MAHKKKSRRQRRARLYRHLLTALNAAQGVVMTTAAVWAMVPHR